MNLVTGATGLLGSHVVYALLQKGEPVIAARRAKSDVSRLKRIFSYYTNDYEQLFNQIRWVEMDLLDSFSIEEALEGVTYVYHCAGFVSFQTKDEEKLKQINEIGTMNLVNACLHKGVNNLCFAGSIAAINNNDYKLQLNEAVFWKTSGDESYYAISKYNAEREVWRGMEEGLNVVIVSPGVILAPGFWDQSSGKLFKFCSEGRLFYTDGVTGYVDAMDVANIMVKLVEEKKFGERYIVIENHYSFKEIFSLIQREFGKRPPSLKAPTFLLKLGVFADGILSKLTGKEQVLTKDTVRSATGSKKHSNQKLLNQLNFSYKPLGDTIKFICQAFASDRNKGLI